MNTLLIGEGAPGIQTLRGLADCGHRIMAVMTSPAPANARVANLWAVAKTFGCRTWPAILVKQAAFAAELRHAAIDVILNVHSLHIIHPEVLAAVGVGCFNLHPGPLPRYAGLNPVSWAIYRGEATHGVTVHKMLPEIDAGPIVYQVLFPIEDTDTALSVTLRCVREGVPLLEKLLDAAAVSAASIPLVPQDLSRREYFGRAVPANGLLCWALSARDVVNFIRSCDFHPFRSSWGHPRTKVAAQEIAVVKASLTHHPCDAAPGTVTKSSNTLWVAAKDEWVAVHKIMVYDKYVNPADLLHPGDLLEDISPSSHSVWPAIRLAN